MDVKIKYLLWGAVIGGAIAVMICILVLKGSLDSFTIKGKDFTLEMEGRKIEHEKLLNEMWENDFARDGLVGWIKRKDYYNINDAALISAIKKLPSSSPLAVSLKVMENETQGPWEEKSQKVFISVPDNQYVSAGEVQTWRNSKLGDKTLIFETAASGPVELLCKCDKRGRRPEDDTIGEYAFHITKVDFKKLVNGDSTKAWVNMTVKD
jgi:hypothetical protein